MMLKLTKEQADAVRGEYLNHYRLEPCEIDGYYYLPADVLDEPNYAGAFDVLKQCAVVEATE